MNVNRVELLKKNAIGVTGSTTFRSKNYKV